MKTLTEVAEALAVAGLHAAAETAARIIAEPEEQLKALVLAAGALAQGASRSGRGVARHAVGTDATGPNSSRWSLMTGK